MKSLLSYAVVFLGAGIGGALRHAANLMGARFARPELPLSTFAVNVIGSFAAGILVGYFASRGENSATLRLFALTGVLGGFTTFSAFSLEVTRFVERGAIGSAFAYGLGSVLVSVAAALGGLAVVRS